MVAWLGIPLDVSFFVCGVFSFLGVLFCFWWTLFSAWCFVLMHFVFDGFLVFLIFGGRPMTNKIKNWDEISISWIRLRTILAAWEWVRAPKQPPEKRTNNMMTRI